MSGQIGDPRTRVYPRTDTYPDGRKGLLPDKYYEEMMKTDDQLMEIDCQLDPATTVEPDDPPLEIHNGDTTNPHCN